jgi:NAD(P)-dependent dehydrogenase (short-subunit alcohol dehydrogenase family)
MAAHAFAREGCHLHLTARSGDALKAIKDKITAEHNVNVHLHVLDLCVSDNLVTLAHKAAGCDILINNAGDVPSGPIESLTEADWRRGYDLKLFGYIGLTREIYAQMKARGDGVIINDIGAAGERHDADYIAGSTANAGLMAFSRALGGRSLEDGIRVLGVNPGPVATDRIVSLMKTRASAALGDENRWEEFTRRFPLGRAARVEEVADTIVFLASDRASYTSGTIITIDGGLSARNSM